MESQATRAKKLYLLNFCTETLPEKEITTQRTEAAIDQASRLKVLSHEPPFFLKTALHISIVCYSRSLVPPFTISLAGVVQGSITAHTKVNHQSDFSREMGSCVPIVGSAGAFLKWEVLGAHLTYKNLCLGTLDVEARAINICPLANFSSLEIAKMGQN